MIITTQLAQLVNDYGDYALVKIYRELISSELIKFFFYLTSLFMLSSIALSIYFRKMSSYVVTFWISWLCIIPVNEMPFSFLIFKLATRSISSSLYKSTASIFSSNGKDSLPPGFVFNTLFRAGTMGVKDEKLQKMIVYAIDNCLPVAKNRNGNILSAADLFNVKVNYHDMKAIGFVYNFDRSILSSREIEYEGRVTNCFDFIESTNKDIQKKAEFQLKKNWREKLWGKYPVGSNVTMLNNIAMNIAHANIVQSSYLKENSNFKDDHIPMDITGTYAPSVNITKGLMSKTPGSFALTLGLMSFPSAVTRFLNIDYFYDSAGKLHKINQKLLSIPYVVAYIQLVLKILFPLVLMTPFLGTWKVTRIWCSTWFMTVLTPWVLDFTRSLSNSVLLHTIDLKKYAAESSIAGSSIRPELEIVNVDFNLVTKILEDTSLMMNVFLNCEMALWGILMGGVPILYAVNQKSVGNIFSRFLESSKNSLFYFGAQNILRGRNLYNQLNMQKYSNSMSLKESTSDRFMIKNHNSKQMGSAVSHMKINDMPKNNTEE